MAYCTECGAQLLEGSKYCAQCGAAVPARQETVAAPGGKAPGSDGAAQVAMLAAEALANACVVEAPDAAGEFAAGMWNDDVLSTAEAAAAQIAQGAAQQAQALQPNARRPSDGAAPKPKKKSKLPLVIIAAVAIVLFAVYVVPRFIPHPHDSHEDTTLPSATSQASSSASAAAVPSGENASGASGAAEPGASASQGASGSSSTQQPAESAAASSSTAPASPQSFSTNEWPKLAEFTWLTGDAAKGKVPSGATRLTDLGAVKGGWKAYLYDSDMEWLLHVAIEVEQSDVTVALDWYYVRDGATGQSHEDTTPTSFFSGTWDSGMLDATGSGRVTIAVFWERDGHQYATGSFMWPSGETGTIALVRP